MVSAILTTGSCGVSADSTLRSTASCIERLKEASVEGRSCWVMSHILIHSAMHRQAIMEKLNKEAKHVHKIPVCARV